MAKIVRAVAFVALALHVVACVYVVGSRIAFPGQLEWMTGSVLDHVERVRAGLPIYTAPSATWIPYIYPPLYSWVGAALGGSALACRLVSVASALVEGALVVRVARDLGASRRYAGLAAGLFFACFSFSGWFYDVERSDTLFGAMALGVCAIVLRSRRLPILALAGALAGVAFFAKQQAIFYAFGAVLGLAAATRARDASRLREAGVFALACSAVLGAVGFACERASHGWFSYYVLDMPRAHGIMWALAPDVATHELVLGFLLVGVTVGSCVAAARELRARGDRRTILFGAFLLTGFGAAVSSRLHVGGWINVLQPWTSFASIATALVASKLDERAAASREHRGARLLAIAFTGAIAAQCIALGYDPREYVPRAGMRAATARFHARVRELERRGEVLLVSQGHVTRERHFQMSALADVVRVEGHSPPDLVEALRARRFAAILDDARIAGDPPPVLWPPVMLEDVADLESPLFASYYVSERLDDEWVTLPMAAPAMPRWILLPRKLALPRSTPRDELKRLHLEEMRLASDRALELHAGKQPAYGPEDIERLAQDPERPR
jgi:hypothetical protein